MIIQLPGTVRAPAAAREFVRSNLESILTPAHAALGDDLALIVSELVTNSVHAQARTIEVEVRVDDERIEVHVTDDAGGWPTVQAATADSLDGRGLEIVDQLADSWRTESRARGKSVIATRRRPE